MKKIILFIMLTGLFLVGCKQSSSTDKNNFITEENTEELVSFGDKISKDDALSAAEMLSKFKNIKAGDSITVKFASTINDVCSKKGCWMKLPLNENTETMVRFKDYGFFMPLNSTGKEVIVEGKAFVKETTVDELKHYAEDAGKSKEEIAKITEPKVEFAFEANGVLMKK